MNKYSLAALSIFLAGLAALASGIFDPIVCTKEDRARIQLKRLAMAIDDFSLDTGRLPADLSQLLDSQLLGWDGPYVRTLSLLDPWGEPYIYRIDSIDSSRYLVAFIPPQHVHTATSHSVLHRRAIAADPASPPWPIEQTETMSDLESCRRDDRSNRLQAGSYKKRRCCSQP